MATFPPRSGNLPQVVDRILPQVDRLNVVFNEYHSVPHKYRNRPGLCPIIPEEDTKDVGKFYPDVSDAEYVFLIDDDVEYPKDYITEMVDKFDDLPEGRFLGGLHTSIYRKPKPGLTIQKMRRYARYHLFPRKIAAFRNITSFIPIISTVPYLWIRSPRIRRFFAVGTCHPMHICVEARNSSMCGLHGGAMIKA